MVEKLKSGIYIIVNSITHKIYIGSAVDFRVRKNDHFKRLKKGDHENDHLQNSYNKHGKKCFKFIIVEYVPDHNNLTIREQVWMDSFEKHMKYNILDVAGNTLGYKHTEEAKQLMSIAKKGKPLTKEHREKIGKSGKGKGKGIPLTKEHRQKISKGRIGKYGGEKNPMFGKNHTDKTKKKISQANTGRTHSDDTKQRISEAMLGEKHPWWGRNHTPETKKKISQANGVKIKQINPKTGGIIKIWNSISDAAKFYNIDHTAISRACRGKSKTSCGFKWEYL